MATELLEGKMGLWEAFLRRLWSRDRRQAEIFKFLPYRRRDFNRATVCILCRYMGIQYMVKEEQDTGPSAVPRLALSQGLDHSGQEGGQYQSSSLGSLRTTSPLLGPVSCLFFSETPLKDWGLEHLCSLRLLLVSHVRRLTTSLCSQTSSSINSESEDRVW